MKRTSFILLLFFFFTPALQSQSVRIAEITGMGIFRLDDQRYFKLQNLLIPSLDDTNHIVASFAKEIRMWEEKSLLNREFTIVHPFKAASHMADTLTGDLAVKTTVWSNRVTRWYLEKGYAVYTGTPDDEDYGKMISSQADAQMNKLGIWKALYYDGRNLRPFIELTAEDIAEKEKQEVELLGEKLERERLRFQPGDQELLLMPTAYTMPAGKAYLSDYELLFINFNFAPTSSTHLGFFSMFPVTNDFLQTLSVGVKQRYINIPKLSAALWGTYNPQSGLFSAGNVFSYGYKRSSLHAAVGMIKDISRDGKTSDDWLFDGLDGEKAEIVLMLGYRYDARKVSFIAEYTNSTSIADDIYGLLSLGFRFRGENISWEISGIRPITEDSPSLILLPMLKATFLF